MGERVALATECAAKKPVLCIEYLITARRDAFKERGGEVDADAYFRDAMDWLEARHGKENVVAANIQRDETSPHLVAYIVPLVHSEEKMRRRSVITGTNPDGSKRRETREYRQPAVVRLSAAHFQGAPGQLSKLQTDFAETVGVHHGLVRGLTRSKAKHKSVRQWYSELEVLENDPRLKPMALVDVPDGPSLLDVGDRRRRIDKARLAAEAQNAKARLHNTQRVGLLKKLAGRGIGADEANRERLRWAAIASESRSRLDEARLEAALARRERDELSSAVDSRVARILELERTLAALEEIAAHAICEKEREMAVSSRLRDELDRLSPRGKRSEATPQVACQSHSESYDPGAWPIRE